MAVELGTGFVSIVPSARGFGPKLQKEVGGAGDAAGTSAGRGFASKFSSGTKGLGASVGRGLKTGLGAAFAGGVAVAGVVAFGNELLTTGAQVEQFRKKSDTVFEGSSGAVKAWADKNNEAFGVTDDQLTGMAASFGDLLKPMGFTSDQAAKMSTDVVGLSGALSSWSGGTTSAAEASDILAKAMLGETDGLKSLGISISAAEIDAKLAAKGQDKLTGSALAQAKATATQELIFEKSTDAQKAWAAGGNKALLAQNNLKAKIGELKETLAEKLTPAITAAATWVGNMMPKAIALGKRAFTALQPTIQTVAAWLRDKIPPTLERLRAGFAAAATWVGNMMPKAIALGKRAFTALQPTIQTVAAWLRDKIPPTLERLRAGFAVVVAWVKANWPKISAAVSSAMNTVRAIISAVITVVTAAWNTWGTTLIDFVHRVWGPIQLIIKGAMNVIQGVIKTVTALIHGDWGKAWDGVKQIFRGIWQAIQGIVRLAIENVRLRIVMVMDLIKAVFGGVWNSILGAIGTVLGAIKAVIVGYFNAYKLVITTVFNAVKAVVSTVWRGIKATISGAVSGIKSVVSIGFSLLKGMITRPIDQAKTTISTIFSGIKTLFSGLPAKLGGALSGLASAVAAPFKAMGAAIKSAWNSTIGGKGINIPDIPGLPGRGKRFEIPRLHTGGPVTGPAGTEQLRILQAGEWVLSRPQVAALARPTAVAAAGAGRGAGVEFSGDLYLSDEVDVDMLNRKISFASMAGSFG